VRKAAVGRSVVRETAVRHGKVRKATVRRGEVREAAVRRGEVRRQPLDTFADHVQGNDAARKAKLQNALARSGVFMRPKSTHCPRYKEKQSYETDQPSWWNSFHRPHLRSLCGLT